MLYLITALVAARRTVADGYDGVGFVLALQRLDLARFQPQPPGYPLFVGLGRLVHALGVPPATALAVVSALLLGAGIGALAVAVKRWAGPVAGGLSAALLALSPLSYALAVATLSDGAGLGGLLLAIYLWGRGGASAHLVGGALLGAALGIRPTYAPLGALLLGVLGAHSGRRALFRASVSAAAAVVAWLVPFALLVGPRTLWSVVAAHFYGHFTDFGGAVTADPTPGLPVAALLRGLAQAALGPAWPLAVLLLLGALVSGPPRSWPAPARRLVATLLVGLAVYLILALLALPVRGHARHLLPAVAMLLVLFAVSLGSALAVAGRRVRLALQLGCALLIGWLGVTSARTIWSFRAPTPGAALAQYVAASYPRGTLLYGGRAARFLDLYWGSGSARPTLHFGDVLTEAARLDRLPAEVLVTSEVLASAASRARLRTVARFCYDPRLPAGLRFDPYADGCVELRAYRFLP